jgi:hypothetical protein
MGWQEGSARGIGEAFINKGVFVSKKALPLPRQKRSPVGAMDVKPLRYKG